MKDWARIHGSLPLYMPTCMLLPWSLERLSLSTVRALCTSGPSRRSGGRTDGATNQDSLALYEARGILTAPKPSALRFFSTRHFPLNLRGAHWRELFLCRASEHCFGNNMPVLAAVRGERNSKTSNMHSNTCTHEKVRQSLHTVMWRRPKPSHWQIAHCQILQK